MDAPSEVDRRVSVSRGYGVEFARDAGLSTTDVADLRHRAHGPVFTFCYESLTLDTKKYELSQYVDLLAYYLGNVISNRI